MIANNSTNMNICHNDPPGCINPPNLNKTTALLDCAASVSCLGKEAEAALAKIQEQNFALGTPSKGNKIMTTQTLTLLLNKLPISARRVFRVPDIPHNLIAAAELIDAGCEIYLHRHGFGIEYEGETLYKG